MSVAKEQAAADAPLVAVQRNASRLAMEEGAELSVVVPFFAWDVVPLIRRLLALASGIDARIEFVFVDDASADGALARAAWQILQHASPPASLGVCARNLGRSRVRNLLCQLATGQYLLYLDCDMWPDREDFLARCVDWARRGDRDVVYGGRSATTVVRCGPEYRLHAAFTRGREMVPVEVRRNSPVFHFYSCNFVARRSVLQEVPLNEAFRGWGWEDVEWAARVAQHFTITHEDNPASHLGLLTPPQMLAKYQESVGNYRLMLREWPDLVKPQPLYRAARVLRALHASAWVAGLARRTALSERLPLAIRLRALMLFKAALYAPLTR